MLGNYRVASLLVASRVVHSSIELLSYVYTTSRKVVGSIPDEIIVSFFNLPNVSSCDIASHAPHPKSE
jgi:hypothetical protein